MNPGGVVFTGCSRLPSHVTKPRPIGVLVMVEVEELRDPAACIPTVCHALDCSQSCGLVRSSNIISRLVKFHLDVLGQSLVMLGVLKGLELRVSA